MLCYGKTPDRSLEENTLQGKRSVSFQIIMHHFFLSPLWLQRLDSEQTFWMRCETSSGNFWKTSSPLFKHQETYRPWKTEKLPGKKNLQFLVMLEYKILLRCYLSETERRPHFWLLMNCKNPSSLLSVQDHHISRVCQAPLHHVQAQVSYSVTRFMLRSAVGKHSIMLLLWYCFNYK